MKNELLKLLKSSKGYISGEELGAKLGVSRAAVWKAIKNLREEGYTIDALTNNGYRLLESGDLLNAADVQADLETTFIGKNLKVLETVDSTNTYLRNLGAKNAEEGTVVIAHEQTNGRGRRGRQWSADKGDGLWMSILLKPDIEPKDASRITLVAGISVCDAIRNMGFDASIKWPNDIIINGKKVCGILTEMNAQIDFVDFVVVGIGVNVNTQDFPKELKDVAISLKQADGIGAKRSKVAAEIINRLEKNYMIYVEQGFAAMKKSYEENCITLNSHVRVISKESFEGIAVGINDDGELIVERNDGTKEIVFSGEVSVRGVL